MAIYGGNPILDNIKVYNLNQALDGSGIHFIDVNMVCKNMLIYQNNVNEWIDVDGYSGYGGGVALENADINFINSTIADNQSEYAGALYLSHESNLTIVIVNNLK